MILRSAQLIGFDEFKTKKTEAEQCFGNQEHPVALVISLIVTVSVVTRQYSRLYPEAKRVWNSPHRRRAPRLPSSLDASSGVADPGRRAGNGHRKHGVRPPRSPLHMAVSDPLALGVADPGLAYGYSAAFPVRPESASGLTDIGHSPDPAFPQIDDLVLGGPRRKAGRQRPE